jgi:pyruvate,water dikinase
MPAADLWRGAHDLLTAAMAYLGALMVSTMGSGAGAELIFTQVYEKLVKKAGDPPALAYLLGYDSTPIRAEKSLYDLAQWCREQPALAAYLLGNSSEQVVAQLQDAAPPAGPEAEAWRAFGERLQNHLQQYGHIIYTLDVAQPLPLDHPAPMIETVKMYLRGEGANPHERQHAAEEKRIRSTQAMGARLKGLRRWAFTKALAWGQSLAEVRETAIAGIGQGYPTLRRMLRELGRRLVDAGAIAAPEDIYWLERNELESAVAALDSHAPLASLAGSVAAHRAAWQAAKRASPPPMLPPSRKYMGFDVGAFVPESGDSQSGDTIKGVPTSAGRVTAPARVLHGPEDFGQMRPGEVLVAAITTPAWTPLFAMASAVVTDVGGPLSHGSIVAREYNIPAVMGTGVATRRIHSGQVITVDGSAGTVSLAKAG